MALEVEDGTGKSTAESYISVADATTYHTARGNSTWNDIVELLTLDVAPGGTWEKVTQSPAQQAGKLVSSFKC